MAYYRQRGDVLYVYKVVNAKGFVTGRGMAWNASAVGVVREVGKNGCVVEVKLHDDYSRVGSTHKTRTFKITNGQIWERIGDV